ncbi:hypothetical protein GZ77_05105 [Endozoicomonas montiporae]|uniref:Tyr recombinase domain-containing protein n=2 Tax=Endozoicomonas montiporae TaxID=1027273 RepID=A0A081NBR9_9GAMM|nr:site-specific integrase [Endozoicomonas montiporae]AMO56194.1 integrase [Endozoicomonas montiporae CL-33]KEQ15892.1 hypothetical protein GZ77_05105 [Endozoicomonas montiporae]
MSANNNKEHKKPLTNRGIVTLKPGEVRADTAQHTGLRVACGKEGRKSFIYRFRSPVTQKLVQITLGHYPEMSLLDARSEHRRLKLIREKGECPKLYLQKARESEQADLQKAEAEEAENRFQVHDLVELYLTGHVESKNVNGKIISGARNRKGQEEVRRTLEFDVTKVIGNIPASALTKKDVTELISRIISRGAPVQAGNVMRELNAAYEYAIGTGKLDDEFINPVEQAKKTLIRAHKGKLTAKKKSRYLSEKELREFLFWLPKSGFSQTQKNVLYLALFTGARTGEVCNAEWSEIDLKNAVWQIPDPKNSIPRSVQLSRQAVSLLTNLKKVNGFYPFQTSVKKRPLKQKSLTETLWALRNPKKVAYNRKYSVEQLAPKFLDGWAPHDLRRTVKTGLARMQCPYEVSEAVLGHVQQGMEGVYNQHRFEPQCREWLQTWCDYLDSL